MADLAMTATAGDPALLARHALGEAEGALDAFAAQFAVVAAAVDADREDEAWTTVAGLTSPLADFAGFCETIGKELPGSAADLRGLALATEAAFEELLAALDRRDPIALGAAARHRFPWLLGEARRLFRQHASGVRRAPRSTPPPAACHPVPPPACLERSLAVLGRHVSPEDRADLESAPASAACLAFRAGRWELPTEDGRCVLLHCTLEPAAEAERRVAAWAASREVNWNGIVVAIGAGGFYQVEALHRRLGPQGLLLVIDDDPAACRLALSCRDLRALAAGPGAFFLVCTADPQRLGCEIYQLLRRREQIDVQVHVLRSWQLARPTAGERVLTTLLAQTRVEIMNRCTLAAFSAEWQQHALLNLPRLSLGPGVEALCGQFPGCPALVIAAGPSLAAGLSTIAALRERCLLIAVGTALRPLLAAGIRPHLVVQLDSDPVTLKQYAGLDLEGIYLVTADSVFPPVMAGFGERLFGFSATLLDYGDWVNGFGVCRGKLAIGGTVSLTAIDLALRLDCQPVITFGLDLAMREDGTTHAGNSVYDGERLTGDKLVRVPGNWQPTVPTTPQFANYIQMMSTFIDEVHRQFPRAVYNANVAGARLHGMPAVLPEAVPGLVGEGCPGGGERVVRCHREGPRAPRSAVERALGQALAELRRLARAANRAAARIADDLVDRDVTPALLQALTRADAQLRRTPLGLQLVNGAIRDVCMHVQSQREVGTNPAKTLAQSKMLYRQIAGAAAWLAGLIENSQATYTRLVNEGFGGRNDP